MTRDKSSELNAKKKQGIQNKRRGYTTEKQLERFLNNNGIPSKRVRLSGRMKYLKVEELRGDVNIQLADSLIHVEVKSRKKLPAYVTGIKKSMPYNVKEIDSLCYILTEKEFLDLVKNGSLPSNGLKIKITRCKQLADWFKQDNAEIVAMKEYGKRTWYFAVHIRAISKIGGAF